MLFAASAAAEQQGAAADEAAAGQAQEKQQLFSLRELLPYPTGMSAGLLSLEKARNHPYPNSFDLNASLAGGLNVHAYRHHVFMKTTGQGVELTRDLGGGRFTQFAAATFDTTPLLQGSFGVKYSRLSPRRTFTLATVYMPQIDAGQELANSTHYLFAVATSGFGAEHKFARIGNVTGKWKWREDAMVAFMGDTPSLIGLTEWNRDFQAVFEAPPSRGFFNFRPYAAYGMKLDGRDTILGFLRMSKLYSTHEWGRLFTMNRSAGAGFYAELPNGVKLSFGVETDRDFQLEKTSASLRMPLGRKMDLALEYDGDRGYRDFFRPWQKDRTRLQLMHNSGRIQWGAFFEIRPGETVSGVSMNIGLDSETPPPLVPESDYLTPYTDRNAVKNINASHALCGLYSTFDEAAAALDTPARVAQFSNCLNFSGSDNPIKINSPQQVFAGAEANCRSTAWLQAKILNQHGYESYVVGYQGTQMEMGVRTDSSFDIKHAVTAYRDPVTGTWNIMDFDRYLQTDAKTIQEAMEIYNPNHMGIVIEDPDHLLPQGAWLSPAFQTVRDWIADSPK